MSYPRPALRRQSSKVRFSRGDMSPVGTMASDSTVHGVHHRHGSSSQPAQMHQPDEHNLYDANSYAFAATEISLSQSQDAPRDRSSGLYHHLPHEEDEEVSLRPVDSESQRYQSFQGDDRNDAYTATPPRLTSRRFSPAHRPSDDVFLHEQHGVAAQDVSPRNSTVMNTYSLPAHPLYQSSQVSPQTRPSSGFRASLVMPSVSPGSPQRAIPHEAIVERGDYPGSPHRGSPFRSSAPVQGATPPRIMLEQQRASYPHNSPRMDNMQYGSPRGENRRSPIPDQARRDSGFARYDEYDRRVSPVPPYQSPRDSFARPSDEYDEKRFAGSPRGDSRHDSDATLYGEMKGKRSLFDEDRRPSRSEYRKRSVSDADSRDGGDMHRKTTRQVEAGEDEDESYHVKGGVFSQLLRLTGHGATLRRRVPSKGAGMNSRAASTQGGELPTMKSLGLKRVGSSVSTAWGDYELDQYDPRITGQKKKKARSNSLSNLPFMRTNSSDGASTIKKKRRSSIQFHVADIITRQQFVLKLAKALMTFGAPSHRIESQLAATALVLEIDAQFIHFPSIVIASFGDVDTRTSETHFVKAPGGLDLGKLHRVHNIYKAVVHDELDAAEGTRRIHTLLKAPMEYNLWQRMILAFLCSGIIGPLGFGGSFIDGLASGFLGILLSFMQLHVASKSAMYSNIFEISIATVISFTARGLSTTGIFCYQAVASAGVVLILPGYTILCGSLELASKNIVSGSVRMVYAIIYSLFLGFGITIGSDLFYVLDRPARRASNAAAIAAKSAISLSGTFVPSDFLSSSFSGMNASSTTFVPFNGTFTFSNATTDAITSGLQQGAIICNRQPDWPWYRQSMPPIYMIALVPAFSILLSLWNMQPLRSRQLPVMVVISCIGYSTNTLANHYIFDRSDVVSAIGAFVIGILGNIYSRVFGGTAFTSMVTGVLFLVPSGIAAAGGLAMTTNADHDNSYSQGLIIGFRMVQVAIGITVGLFGSGLLIYSFGRKKGTALFAF